MQAGGRKHLHLCAVLLVQYPQEVRHQRRDVALAFAQGRDTQLERTDTKIEILPEIPIKDLPVQVLVGSGHDPNVYVDDPIPTDAQNFPLLKHTQHTRLYGPTDLADFVEKDSAVVGHFEQAGLAAFACAGERAALVTEQFAFKQTLG